MILLLSLMLIETIDRFVKKIMLEKKMKELNKQIEKDLEKTLKKLTEKTENGEIEEL